MYFNIFIFPFPFISFFLYTLFVHRHRIRHVCLTTCEDISLYLEHAWTDQVIQTPMDLFFSGN